VIERTLEEAHVPRRHLLNGSHLPAVVVSKSLTNAWHWDVGDGSKSFATFFQAQTGAHNEKNGGVYTWFLLPTINVAILVGSPKVLCSLEWDGRQLPHGSTSFIPTQSSGDFRASLHVNVRTAGLRCLPDTHAPVLSLFASLNKIVMKYQDHHAQFTATGSQLSRQKLVAEIEAAGSKGHWVDVVVRTRSQPSCTAAYTRGTLRAVVAGTSNFLVAGWSPPHKRKSVQLCDLRLAEESWAASPSAKPASKKQKRYHKRGRNKYRKPSQILADSDPALVKP
jgi:hypothetical protein